MRDLFIAICLACVAAASAVAQVSIGIGVSLPGVQIGINLPAYPNLVPVPGYPVYYAPQARANYFFYDGMYWVFQNDNWYASSWYNGPWWAVDIDAVPLFVLRVPVRYYRQPPPYFQGWQREQPPRWGEHWGNDWDTRHRGWDQWDRRAAPARAPLPTFQRQYPGTRYPGVEQQPQLQGRNYRYEPREPVVRQHYEVQGARPAATPPPRPQQQARPPAQQQPRPPAPQQARPPVQQQDRPAAQPDRPAQPRDQTPPGKAKGHDDQGRDKGDNRGQGQDRGRDKRGD